MNIGFIIGSVVGVFISGIYLGIDTKVLEFPVVGDKVLDRSFYRCKFNVLYT